MVKQGTPAMKNRVPTASAAQAHRRQHSTSKHPQSTAQLQIEGDVLDGNAEHSPVALHLGNP